MPACQIEPKTFDDVMAVNMTANYRLIRSLDLLLRASPSGRALFMTSGVAVSRRAYWSAYAASKAALEAYVQSYAKEVSVTNLKVNLMNPGAPAQLCALKLCPAKTQTVSPNPPTSRL